MKAFLAKIATFYMFAGVFFSTMLTISWFWSLGVTLFTQFDAWFSLAGFFGLGASVMINMVVEPIIRALFWLPSMLSLLSPDTPIGFWQWMFPGFYDPLISVEKISQ